MPSPVTVVWFRQDLRLDDNPAVIAAIDRKASIVPVYIYSPDEEGDWPPGAASRVWLHHSLNSLASSLLKRNCQLIIRRGDALKELKEIANDTGADVLAFNRRYEPAAIKQQEKVATGMKKAGLTVRAFNGSLMHDPDEVRTGGGEPYKVFTPYYKSFSKLDIPEPMSASGTLSSPAKWPKSLKINDLDLLPKRDWHESMMRHWTVGEAAATKQLDTFCAKAVGDYDTARDIPGEDGTSRLSPHLHFGEISPRRVWHQIQSVSKRAIGPVTFAKEIVWREFAHHVLYHHPDTPTKPLYKKYESFPWKRDKKSLERWQKGLTGYPYIDAGMRQLWATGWMHNRVRMAVASFLVKHLLIHWLDGARWFWDTLVDADLANNTLNWQWSAGCGADAAPYFRIFNPILQSQKFDPEGDYIRRWVPELENVPEKYIHEPWTAPLLAGDYPEPIVDHSAARERALDALKQV